MSKYSRDSRHTAGTHPGSFQGHGRFIISPCLDPNSRRICAGLSETLASRRGKLVRRNPNPSSSLPLRCRGIVKSLNRTRFKSRAGQTRNGNTRIKSQFSRNEARNSLSLSLSPRTHFFLVVYESKWDKNEDLKLEQSRDAPVAATAKLPNVYLMRYTRFAESRSGKVFYFNRRDRCAPGVGVLLHCVARCFKRCNDSPFLSSVFPFAGSLIPAYENPTSKINSVASQEITLVWVYFTFYIRNDIRNIHCIHRSFNLSLA